MQSSEWENVWIIYQVLSNQISNHLVTMLPQNFTVYTPSNYEEERIWYIIFKFRVIYQVVLLYILNSFNSFSPSQKVVLKPHILHMNPFLINFCWEDHHQQQNIINSWQEGPLDFFLNLSHCATHSVKTWIFLFVFLDGLSMTTFVPKILLNMRIRAILLLGRKAMTNLDSILKSRDITLPTKVHLVKAMVFPVVIYRCESWTIKKAERQRIDAFELWCWRKLLSPLACEIKPVNPEGNQS